MRTVYWYVAVTTTRGVFRHRPRCPCLMEPRLLAGDARCSPTFSWWALETPMTMARMVHAGGQAESVEATAARSEERSGQCRRCNMCLLTPPGLTGFDSHMLTEMEEEESCLTDSRKALPQRWHIVVYITPRRIAACGYCTDSAPKAPTRSGGEPSNNGK